MTAGQRVALVGLGEVGQILAADLHRLESVQLVAWDRLFPVTASEPRRAVRSLAYLREAASMTEAVKDCTLVISAVTADECVAAAREAARALAPGTFYFDLNSVSPATKAEAAHVVEMAGGCYIEGAVMSSISPQRIASPIWLGGPHARRFLPLATSLGFTAAAVFSDVIGSASAAKMCRSVVIKGLEALLTESLLAARCYGVEQAVLGSLSDLLPGADWPKMAHYMIGRSLQHGRRRAEEMREVARTIAAAGLDPWMSLGCADRQRWAGTHADALRHESLADLLDAVLVHIPARAPDARAHSRDAERA